MFGILPFVVIGSLGGLAHLTGRSVRVERGMSLLRMLTAQPTTKWSSLPVADRASVLLALKKLKANAYVSVLTSGRTDPTPQEMTLIPNETLLLAAQGINISKLQP